MIYTLPDIVDYFSWSPAASDREISPTGPYCQSHWPLLPVPLAPIAGFFCNSSVGIVGGLAAGGRSDRKVKYY